MGSTEEHDMPTTGTPAGATAIPQESQTYRNARLWLQIDAAVHKLQEWVGKITSMKHPPDGPRADYNPDDDLRREFYRGAQWGAGMRSPHNGDSGGIQWATVLSAVGIMITVLGAWWTISGKLGGVDAKMDSVQKAQSLETEQRARERSEILELIRQANDRINRLEDRDRRNYPPNP